MHSNYVTLCWAQGKGFRLAKGSPTHLRLLNLQHNLDTITHWSTREHKLCSSRNKSTHTHTHTNECIRSRPWIKGNANMNDWWLDCLHTRHWTPAFNHRFLCVGNVMGNVKRSTLKISRTDDASSHWDSHVIQIIVAIFHTFMKCFPLKNVGVVEIID